MSRVDEKDVQLVQTFGEKEYLRNAQMSGFIPAFKYDVGKRYILFALKLGRKMSGELQMGRLPSWVFFEEMTGLKPIIHEEADTEGDIVYDVTVPAVEQILQLYMTNPETIEKAPMLQYKLNMKTDFAEILYKPIKSALELPTDEEKRNALVGLIETAKMHYIDNFTDLRTVSAYTVGTKVNGTFRAGAILGPEQDRETFNKMKAAANLNTEMLRVRFENEKGFTPDKRDTEDYKLAFGKYTFANQEIYNPKLESAILGLQSEIILIDKEWRYVSDANGRSEASATNLSVSQARFKKITSAKFGLNKDIHLDYFPVQMNFLGENKMAAGNAMTAEANTDIKLEEKDIYEKFSGTIHEFSFLKCSQFKQYEVEEYFRTLAQWTKNNLQSIKELEGEVKGAEDLMAEMGFSTEETKSTEDIVNEAVNIATGGVIQPEQNTQQTPTEEVVQPSNTVATGEMVGGNTEVGSIGTNVENAGTPIEVLEKPTQPAGGFPFQ